MTKHCFIKIFDVYQALIEVQISHPNLELDRTMVLRASLIKDGNTTFDIAGLVVQKHLLRRKFYIQKPHIETIFICNLIMIQTISILYWVYPGSNCSRQECTSPITTISSVLQHKLIPEMLLISIPMIIVLSTIRSGQ